MTTIKAGLLALSALLLLSASLPETGPIPLEKPKQEENAADKPDKDVPETTAPPAARPETGEGTTDEKEKDDAKEDETVKAPPPPPPPPIEKEDTAAYKACLSDLAAIGATFAEKESVDDGNGCGVDKPLEVTAVLPGIKIAPAATLRCEAALALARWTRDTVLPMAAKAFPKDDRLVALRQASSYVCRNRNGAATGKLSEHARGNAIDISAFEFSGGKTLTVEPRSKDSTFDGVFQRSVREAACLDFTTVLGPPSDDAHKTHLHLDVTKRRGGFRYCW